MDEIVTRRSRRQGLRAGLRPVLASALRAALTAALRRVEGTRQAIPPEELESFMSTRQRMVRTLSARPVSGAIEVAEPKFTTGWVAPTGESVSDDVVVDAALRILAEQSMRGDFLESPSATRKYLAVRFTSLEHEVFCCLFLDNRHRLIACDELFRGTIDGASVHPREVVKRALAHNAAAVILAHNHPSGVAEPSHADELITLRLKEALAVVDIRVLDHLIVAGAKVVSLAERGVL